MSRRSRAVRQGLQCDSDRAVATGRHPVHRSPGTVRGALLSGHRNAVVRGNMAINLARR